MKSRLYTRTGDLGSTSLADGTRVSKEAPRIEAYGSIDEANAWVGAARAAGRDPLLDSILEFLQHRLYNCSSRLAMPGRESAVRLGPEDVAFLERAIDLLDGLTGPIGGFVLPGGSGAMLHVARTVCRRAERRLWSLARLEPVDEPTQRFVNRASDLLFAAARYVAHKEGPDDVLWNKDLSPPAL